MEEPIATEPRKKDVIQVCPPRNYAKATDLLKIAILSLDYSFGYWNLSLSLLDSVPTENGVAV
ncbi:hypothetical protein ACSYAD_16565 [Acaryochloris marina NIES-2412]|uniref:hypothetical protein n=1 Tax=Acaryochloris marina TaxID=155978 RepID=UPI00201715B5